jgi:hypothetical protein
MRGQNGVVTRTNRKNSTEHPRPPFQRYLQTTGSSPFSVKSNARPFRFLAACVLLICACSEVPKSNPYDPETPKAQQAVGRLTGRIVLPTGFDQARFEDARVELAETANPLEVIRLATLEMTEPVASDDGPRETQSFLIPDLPAGRYVLTTFVRGFRAERDGQSLSPLPVELDIGRIQDLGEIQLVLDESPNVKGAVAGTAELQGAARILQMRRRLGRGFLRPPAFMLRSGLSERRNM